MLNRYPRNGWCLIISVISPGYSVSMDTNPEESTKLSPYDLFLIVPRVLINLLQFYSWVIVLALRILSHDFIFVA
jgi:hypothetical protein